MRRSRVAVIAGLVLVAGCSDDGAGPWPAPCEAGEILITAVDSVTGEPVTGFTAWHRAAENEYPSFLDSLHVEGATARGELKPGGYAVYAHGYEIWNHYLPDHDLPPCASLVAELAPFARPLRVELGPERVTFREGEAAPLMLTVGPGGGTVAVVEWSVRDSAVAEVFGGRTSRTDPWVYGSATGETWVVVRSAESRDSVYVVVEPGSPPGVGEARIVTSGRWVRRYVIPWMQASFLRDGEGSGVLVVAGVNDNRPDPTESFQSRVPLDSLRAGSWPLSWPDSGARLRPFPWDFAGPWAAVEIQTSSPMYGGADTGPGGRVYRSEARSTLTLDSVVVRDPGSPRVVYGRLTMESAVAYEVATGLSDGSSLYRSTGVRRDVRVEFIAEVSEPEPL